ncbi:MAG: NADH-quinone oxidoreductase subunit, partial [Pseudonocardiales bacterium]|nr:NADH-quinone oxidoreductase subunit [Pseudonocardiales bacterium]
VQCNVAYIYVRGEFALGYERLMRAIDDARAKGFLGRDILGSGFDFDVIVLRGAGAYICGEETALLDSLEGYRGQPRLRPPFPAVAGNGGFSRGCPRRPSSESSSAVSSPQMYAPAPA